MARKALTEEEKLHNMKLRLLRKKKERLELEWGNNDEDKKVKCPVCGKEIKEDGLNDVEYVKTKRGTEIFIHTKCVSKWSKE